MGDGVAGFLAVAWRSRILSLEERLRFQDCHVCRDLAFMHSDGCDD